MRANSFIAFTPMNGQKREMEGLLLEWFQSETLLFIYSLLSIIFIDLILAGDNAIVIGMAARNLPKNQQKKVILFGTGGAVLIRVIATICVVWLLKIPWLMVIGGVLLTWIAYKLLIQEEQHDIKAGKSVWEAIRTIIIADAAMGLDNVIAIAGVSQGNILLIILGLLISVPIIVWGSTLFIKLIDRFPIILYFGAGVLAYTAANMISNEQKIAGFFDAQPLYKWLMTAVIIVGVLLAGIWTNKWKEKRVLRTKNKQTTTIHTN